MSYTEHQKRYYENNKEKINEKQRLYGLVNKDKIKKRKKLHYENHKEEGKPKREQYRAANKEALKVINQEYYKKNKEKLKEKQRLYSITHKEEKKQYQKEYRQRIKNQYNAYQRLRKKTNIQCKLGHSIRNRLLIALKRQNSDSKQKAVEYLGCSINDLKTHLENQFQKGMNWENHGLWHIDHILPISKFDLTDEKQAAIACHYTNLQPLWAKQNLIKGNRTI